MNQIQLAFFDARPAPLLLLFLASFSLLSLAACADPPTVDRGVDDDTAVIIEGTATEDRGYGTYPTDASSYLASSHHTGVEGATVTAASVAITGSTTPIEGEAETRADGSFALGLESVNQLMLITAATDDYEGRVLVRNTGSIAIRAMPITTESSVEAETYLEAKERDDNEVREADVALYIDQSFAAEVEAENTNATEAAIAVRDAVIAEFESRGHTAQSPSNQQVQQEKEEAYITLQADLSVATSAQGESEAVRRFEERMAQLDVELNGSAQAQAQTRQSGAAAAIHSDANLSTNADLALRKRATTVAALATVNALAVRMETGNLEAEAGAIEDAGADLAANIRAASSHTDINIAKADFESTTVALLAAGLDVDEEEIEEVQVLFSEAISELRSDIVGATTAEGIARAYATYYSEARAVADANEDFIPGGTATADVLMTWAGMANID